MAVLIDINVASNAIMSIKRILLDEENNNNKWFMSLINLIISKKNCKAEIKDLVGVSFFAP